MKTKIELFFLLLRIIEKKPLKVEIIFQRRSKYTKHFL